MSVIELATVKAIAGGGEKMEAELSAGLDIIAAAEGCMDVGALRCIERPDEFVLRIGWTSIEAHNRFRETSDFQRYRAAIGGALETVVGYAHYSHVTPSAPDR